MHFAGLFFALSALAAGVAADGPGRQQKQNGPKFDENGSPCPVIPSMPNGKCKLLMNQDRPGFDLKSVKGALNSCADACKATTGCVTWAWNDYEGGTCWLKSRESKRIDKVGVWTTSCELAGPSPVCNPMTDIDFEGNDIASVPSKGHGKCCNICNGYPGCKAYSWSGFNGGTCWLKAGVTSVVRKQGVVASTIVPLGGPVCPFEFNTDFVDNDIGNTPAQDAGACCAICKDNSACKAYSWSNYNGGTCWMKSGKGATIQKDGVVSAVLTGF